MLHHRTHWIAVALAAALALLAFEVAGAEAPGTGAAAMFEGRPALAGAQGGMGAQAGLPQGGIGVQGSEASERSLRAPRVIREIREQRERDLAARRPQAGSLSSEPVIAANEALQGLPPR